MELLLTLFLAASVPGWFFISFIWTTTGHWANLVIKLATFGLGILSLILLLFDLGVVLIT